METQDDDKRLHLIRNDNGEWISDEYAVILSKLEVGILKVWAAKQGKTLSVQHGSDGCLWCYKHEIETIDFNVKETTINRKLRIKKSMGKKNVTKQLNKRGLHDEDFRGKLKKNGTMRSLIDLVNSSSDLVLQIRDNYINIYYQGGNIAKINSEKNVEVDKNYFRQYPSNQTEKEDMSAISNKYHKVKKLFEAHDYEDYIKEVKDAMVNYWENVLNGKGLEEKKAQHSICMQNNDSSEYTIIDLEYQVSKQSKFSYQGERRSSKGEIPTPRFDIIAVRNVDHRLCVIELKKGSHALSQKSGVQEHAESFANTIGYNEQTQMAFLEEMTEVLRQKKDDLEIMNKDLWINTKLEPEFIFAYQFKKGEKMYDTFDKQKELFRYYKNKKEYVDGVNYAKDCHVIWLEDGEYKLSDKNKEK